MKLFSTLWQDENGEVSSISIVLITTLLALGSIVGLTTFRDQLVQELGDIGVALESINQSFTTANSTFTDNGIGAQGLSLAAVAPSSCISLNVAASSESQ